MILRENENLVKVVRQHWLVVLNVFLWTGSVIAAYLFAYFYFYFNFFGYFWQVLSGIVLVSVIIVLYKVYIWRKNVLTITDQRIINNEQRGLFDRTVTELLYNDITDISFTQNGITASSYNYGTIIIRMPSQNQIKIEMMPRPSGLIELINQIRMSARPSTMSNASNAPNS